MVWGAGQGAHDLARALANLTERLVDPLKLRSCHQIVGKLFGQRKVIAVILGAGDSVFAVDIRALFFGVVENLIRFHLLDQKLDVRALLLVEEIRTGPANILEAVLHLLQHQLPGLVVEVDYRCARADNGEQRKGEDEFQGKRKAHNDDCDFNWFRKESCINCKILIAKTSLTLAHARSQLFFGNSRIRPQNAAKSRDILGKSACQGDWS